MLQWEIITPLGTPVDPLVYMITATSEGTGLACCFFPVNRVEQREHVMCGEPTSPGGLDTNGSQQPFKVGNAVGSVLSW